MSLDSARYWLSWIELGSTIALFLVAFGVGYEFVADRVSAPLRKKIEEARTEEITRLQNEAAQAQLALTRLKTPRRLSPEQQQRIVAKVSAFAGQKFSLAVRQDPEQFNLLADIKSLLLAAKWDQVPPAGFGDIAIGDVALSFGTGVIVRYKPDASPDTLKIATTLADALNAEEIASKPEADVREYPSLER